MTDQTELNCLLVENLADLETAGHQIDDRLTPIIAEEVGKLVDDFRVQCDWEGESVEIVDLWVALNEWREPEGGDGAYICKFAYRTAQADGEDWFPLSALMGVGLSGAGLYWERSYLNRSIAWSRLVAVNADAIATLDRLGMVYDKSERTFFVPIRIASEALIKGLRDGAFDEALEPIAAALRVAQTSVPHLKPFVDALREEALK